MLDKLTTHQGHRRLKAAVFLAIVELLAIIVAYQLVSSIECRLTDAEMACRAIRTLPVRAFAILAIVFLFFRLRPKSYLHLGGALETRAGSQLWLGLHGFGFALIFLPLWIYGADEMNRSIAPSLAIMLLGAAISATGFLLWMTPFRNWVGWLKSDHFYLPLTLVGAALVPDLAEALRPLWNLTSISDATFALVFLTLSLFSNDIIVDPARYIIGLEGFNVQVGLQCAGVEGVSLLAIFMALYATLMRGKLGQKRFWLVLFPLATLASWAFNIIRISILILIGARLSAEHALNGFHSYAGWLLFTCLALAILFVAHNMRWFHTAPQPEAPQEPFFQNPIAAQILPFIAMMLSGVVAAAFWSDPETGYPLRFAAMLAVLALFSGYLKGLIRAIDLPVIIAGALVGLGWVFTAGPAVGTTADGHTALWVLLRLMGTVALVPVIEELFFRGYVLRRLDIGGIAMRITAIAVSSALFGLLHDRFFAGFAAGVVFALIAIRRNRVSDAIGAHITANAAVALWALARLDWTLI